MSLISLLVVIIVFFVVLHLFRAYIAPSLPYPAGTIVILVMALLMILWLLSSIGIIPNLDIKIP